MVGEPGLIDWVQAESLQNYWSEILPTPLGDLWVVHTESALVQAEFGRVPPTHVGSQPILTGGPARWLGQLFREAMQGRPPLHWNAVRMDLTALECTFLSQATEIPFGTTMSYGALAEWSGFPGRARAAGRAMSRSPIAYLIPTHRVIRQDGTAASGQRDPLNKRLRLWEGITLRSPGVGRDF